MMAELGLPVTAAAVARHYGDLLDGYVLDHADAACAAELGISATMAHTLMTDDRGPRGAWRATCSPPPIALAEAKHARAALASAPWCRSRTPRNAKQRLAAALTAGAAAGAGARDARGRAADTRGRRELAGMLVVTVDPAAAALAAQLRRAGVVRATPRDGHTGAVMGAARAAARARPRPADGAGRHPAGRRRTTSASCSRRTHRPRRLHDRAGARRAWAPTRSCARRPMRCRCASATTASFPHLAAAQGARHRAAGRAAAAHRARYRHAGGPGAVPGNAVAQPRSRALLDRWGLRADARREREGDRMSWRGVIERAVAGEAPSRRRRPGAARLRRSRCADDGGRRAARRRPRRARLLFAQGVHSADPALPRHLPLLHLRASAAPRRPPPI